MRSRLEVLIDLLHARGDAALATHAAAVPGYPLATALAFAVDEHHRPILLISSLAEHTRNLAADPRASFLVAQALGEGEMARVSLVGRVRPVAADARLVARYLRFHPEAARFLDLGDFRFHRFEPERILVVGGFAQAGWLDGQRLMEAPCLSLEREAELLDAAAGALPDDVALLGLDAYGADVTSGGTRRRIVFDAAPVADVDLLAALVASLAA